MQYLILPNTNIQVSRVSFGTARLHHIFSKKKRQQILKTAFTLGITHFDTSPYYGLGLAELELGQFIKQHRSSVTVATKIGLYPFCSPKNRASIVWLYKIIGKIFPNLSKAQVNWSIKKAKNSLDISLKNMNTDYVDFLFLHEPNFKIINTEEFLNWLTEEFNKGKIRYWGLAGEPILLEFFIREQHPLANIIQTRDDIISKPSDIIFKYGRQIQFTYGYLSSYHRIKKRKIDIKDLFKIALSRNNKGSILFSTRNEKRLKKIVELVK